MRRWLRSAGPGLLLLLSGGPGWSETLVDALAAAYTNNPTLLSARAALRATDEEVPQALADWRPTVEVEGSVASQAVQTNTTTGDQRQHRDPRSLAFSVTQPLFRGGRTQAATREAEESVLAQRARLLSTEQDVLLSGVTAYVNVVRDTSVLELNRSNELVLSRQLEAAQDRFRVGEITRTDVHQAESRLAQAQADRIGAEGDLVTSRAVYRNVIGHAPENLEVPEVPSDLPGTEFESMERALERAPDVLAAEYDTRASAHNIDEIKGELLPSLELEGSASVALDGGGENARSETYQATLTLDIPLYQQGSVYSRLRQAKQRAGQNRLLVDQARRDAIEDVASTWETLQTTRAQITAFRTAVEAAAVALEGVQREAEVGSRTVLDVLDAEQELLDARVDLVRARRDEIVAAYALKAVVGSLTARELGLPVALYDPIVHYEEVRGKWTGGRGSGEYDVWDLK